MVEKNNVELDKFFERDIIEFLDEMKSKQTGDNSYVSPEQYYELLNKALSKANSKRGVEIFEQAINKYNSLPKSDTYKGIIFEQIVEMLEMTKKYVKEMGDKTELSVLLNIFLEGHELQDDAPSKITSFEKLKEYRTKQEIKEEEKYYLIKQKVEDKIHEETKNLFVNIRKKKLKEAIASYKKIKSYFKEYPSIFEVEKQDLYSDILAYYMQIKRLRDELQKKKQRIEEKQREEEASEENNQSTTIQKIKEIVDEIKENTKNKDFHLAKGKIIDLRHITSTIPDKHIRSILDSKINTINQKIDFAQRVSEQKA